MLVSYIVLGNNAVTNRYIERSYQMPVHAWSTLFAIVMFPGIRAKEIKHLFPRPQNTISRAVSLLEARGLVKHQTSPTDGREKRLFATAIGEELLAEIRAVSMQRQDEMFAPSPTKSAKLSLPSPGRSPTGPSCSIPVPCRPSRPQERNPTAHETSPMTFTPLDLGLPALPRKSPESRAPRKSGARASRIAGAPGGLRAKLCRGSLVRPRPRPLCAFRRDDRGPQGRAQHAPDAGDGILCL